MGLDQTSLIFLGRRNHPQMQSDRLPSVLLLVFLMMSIGSKQEQEQEQEADLDLRLFSKKNSRFSGSLDWRAPGPTCLPGRQLLEKALRQGHRLEHRFGFVDRFLKLRFG